jgi:serine/threonine protein kinase
VAKALQYCHNRHIIHRDIKSENLVLTSNGDCKVIDFGWSIQGPSNAVCGTLDYLPPEMVDQKDYSCAVDMWSLGILCYELLVGVTPFSDPNNIEVFKKIRKCQVSYPPILPDEAHDLISKVSSYWCLITLLKLLVYDPQKRLRAEDVITHPWILKFNIK